MNTLIDELDSPGYGMEHECFTTDDSIRFESVSKGGAINATHLVIKEVNKGVTIFEKTYTLPFIVYKMTTVSCLRERRISDMKEYVGLGKIIPRLI